MTEVERLANYLQAHGPDEFPTGFYLWLAGEYIKTDPPPLSSDGPEYHGDYQYWSERQLRRFGGVQSSDDRVE